MSGPYSFRPDLKDKAQRPFNRAAQQHWPTTPRRVMNKQVGDAVKARVDKTRQKLTRHQEKMKPIWIAREEKKLWAIHAKRMNHARNSGPKPPYGFSNLKNSHRQALRARAEANVTQRCREKARSLNSVERRMLIKLGGTQSRSQRR
ncbi:MAG: hypothetical protein AAGA97_00910 [Pseudomonadota bacterium]